jgi:hypothetical protein
MMKSDEPGVEMSPRPLLANPALDSSANDLLIPA